MFRQNGGFVFLTLYWFFVLFICGVCILSVLCRARTIVSFILRSAVFAFCSCDTRTIYCSQHKVGLYRIHKRFLLWMCCFSDSIILLSLCCLLNMVLMFFLSTLRYSWRCFLLKYINVPCSSLFARTTSLTMVRQQPCNNPSADKKQIICGI